MLNNPLIPGNAYMYDVNWIVNTLKEAIALYEPLNTKFNDLKAYVMNYFNNLDLSAEVREVIGDMQASGYFDELIYEIAITDGNLQNIVTDWLNDNVTPVGSAVVVDDTLTIQGAAADAKKTGEEFTKRQPQFIAPNVVNGYAVSGADGVLVASVSYKYAEYDISANIGAIGGVKMTLYNYIGFAFYDDNNRYVSGDTGTNLGNKTATISIDIPYRAKTLRVSLLAAENAENLSINQGYMSTRYPLNISFRRCGTNPVGEYIPTNTNITTNLLKLSKGDYINTGLAIYFGVREFDPVDMSLQYSSPAWTYAHTITDDCYALISFLSTSESDIRSNLVINRGSASIIDNAISADTLSFDRKNFEKGSISINKHWITGGVSKLGNGHTLSMGHRGMSSGYPENTMPAFKAAIKAGFDAFETDVQFTSDNVPVLIHDTTIDRTSDGSGNVVDFTYAQLATYDFGSWFSTDFAGITIPTLSEALELCAKAGMTIQLEFKNLPNVYTNAQLDIILAEVLKYNMADYIIWSGATEEQAQYIYGVIGGGTYVFTNLTGIDAALVAQINSLKAIMPNANFIAGTSVLNITSAMVDLLKADLIPLQLAFCDSKTQIEGAPLYSKWLVSDGLIASDILYRSI